MQNRANERTNEIHVELLLFCEFDVRAYVCWYQCQGEVRRKPKRRHNVRVECRIIIDTTYLIFCAMPEKLLVHLKKGTKST